jgi:hypothetical protein|tara:strand:- start:252 stop:482 length:231 start_codon:yes stop_codon:yes gene_type:complete
MKIIILSIIICSALYNECQQPYDKNIEFTTWSDCMREGTHDTLTLYNVMGDEYINTNKVFIKFSCREKMVEPEEKT